MLDPSGMRGMDVAVAVLVEAITAGHTIALYGDYDADGITAAALMSRFLDDAGARQFVYLPERGRDGYGLSKRGIDHALERGAQILVTLDCGTSDHEQLAYARSQGLVPVVVDHHPPNRGLPDAAEVVLNPARDDCGFADRVLSAAGVAFYLVMALRRELRARGWWARGRPEPNLKRYLDLVSLGTVADVVPLVGQNRILVRHGLEELARSSLPGVRAMCRRAGIGAKVDSFDVAFKLAPRINACGRMGDAMAGFELLRTTAVHLAEDMAAKVEEFNQRRRTIQQRMEEEALAKVEAMTDRGHVLVVSSPAWHPGVAGIVASKLVERYYLPAVVLAAEPGGLVVGSARSIDGVDMGAAIAACRDHIVHGGGHPLAAGVTLEASRLPGFVAALEERVASLMGEHPPERELTYDRELSLGDLGDGLVASLEQLAPFGAGNPEPVFVARGVRLSHAREYRGGHLGGRLVHGAVGFDVFGFGMGGLVRLDGSLVDVAFTVRRETFRGRESIRLRLKDIRRHKE